MKLISEPGKASNTVSSVDWPAKWQTLSHGISTARYTDPEFARLEHEKLWQKVWQAAARVDEIPLHNDYCTYEIGDQSILIVRIDSQVIKAYHNVCPHRGTALVEGSGTFANGKIICPFHGWRWDVLGNNVFVLERQEFRNGRLLDSDVALREIEVELFAGFVFINLAANPMPFTEFIAPVRHWLEDMATEEMHHYWWKSIAIPANWKVAQEAFFEAYHVPATHPQLEPAAADFIYGNQSEVSVEFTHQNIEYDALPHGHGRFYGGKKTPMQGHVKKQVGDPVESMAARLNLLVEGMDAQVLKEDVEIIRSLQDKPIPEGSNLGGEYVKALYAAAAAQHRPMPKPTPENIGMWGGEIFIFPNLLLLPQAGNCMMYRVRPDGFDPDRCIFEIFSTKSYPAACKPSRARVQKVTDLSDPQQVLLIPRQDLGNIPRMQKGLHSKGIKHIWLASKHEKMILNMHQELDRYLKP
jgi:phenylpropionate dioxygenase-like ring-hydroxylating dioxygenase large terminal subunit